MAPPPTKSLKFSRQHSTHSTETLETETETETETEDHISKLPDSILIHILTLIPLVDAIRTGSLSKRWNHLWVSIPNLIFHFSEVSDFISFVDRTLILYNSHFINKFYIDFEYDVEFQQNVNSWLRFAVNRKVINLNLLIHDVSYDYDPSLELYNLPRFLFNNVTITYLNLWHCSFRLLCGSRINWSSLSKLSIRRCSIDDDVMEKLLIGCPVLESFELIECFDFVKIEINSVALKELVVDGYYESEPLDVDDVDPVTIVAPYIEVLVITGRIIGRKCRVESLLSLVEASLKFKWSGLYVTDEYEDEDGDADEDEDRDYMELETMLTDILGRIKHVKKLTLGLTCLQAISSHNASQLPSTFSYCKNLILDANLKKGGLQGLASMLQSCPKLETLTINLLSSSWVVSSRYDLAYPTKNFWMKNCHGKYFSCMQHLKMVKIIGLDPGSSQIKHVIEFLQIILKHAKVLEILSINTRATKDSLFKVAQALLRFRRSSPFAEIQLNKQ